MLRPDKAGDELADPARSRADDIVGDVSSGVHLTNDDVLVFGVTSASR